MKYIIDTANTEDIQFAQNLGIRGITANPSLYLKENTSLEDFISHYSNKDLDFLSVEVMGSYDEQLEQALQFHSANPNIVIKINYSIIGLQLANVLSRQNIKCAITLIYTLEQAFLAIQAGANYLFFFVARNEERGVDGLCLLDDVCTLAHRHNNVHVVAASIRNMHQLHSCLNTSVDFIAIPPTLLEKSIEEEIALSSIKNFQEDWNQLKR